MEALKNSLKTAKANFESVAFLKFLVAAGVYIFAAGGLLWLVAGFLPFSSFGLYFVKTLLASSGRILMAGGLLFALVKGADIVFVIVSAVISVGAMAMLIVELAVFSYPSSFESWLFFALFGALATLAIIFGDNFKQMRENAKAASQARTAQRAAAQAAQMQQQQQVQLIACPNCAGPVPINAAFCPNCGAKNQYAPPPQAPPPAPPQAPPNAAPVVEPAPVPPVAEPAPEPATKACVNCGAQIPADAAFCGKCGAKQ